MLIFFLKKAEMAILISGKTDSQRRKLRDKEEYSIMIKRSIRLEDVAILNVYASNNRPSKYTRQKKK